MSRNGARMTVQPLDETDEHRIGDGGQSPAALQHTDGLDHLPVNLSATNHTQGETSSPIQPSNPDQETWRSDERSTGEDSGPQMDGWGSGAASFQGGIKKRNSRQQEQNKHAQQRYRARRKAQFEDLQETVDELNAQIKALEKERAHRQALEVEVAQLRAATAALAASVAVDGSAIATRTHPSPFSHQLPSSSNIEAVISWAESQGLDKAAPPLQALLHALSGQSMLSAPTIPSVPSNQSVPIDAANVPLLQLQEMLLAYGQELGHFATSNGITSTAAAAGYSNSSPLSQAENSLPHGVQATLDQFIKMGIELAKLVLNASGAAVEVLLHDGGAPSTHHGTADDVRRWRNVAAQVALNSQQNLRITIWRAAFLTQLDAVYNKRMQLKAQVVQATEPAQGSGMQWSEVLLLRAANSSGFALPAQAEAELFGAAEELLRNIEENRAAVVAALSNLLCTILTPVQAIRYLVASHPFSWNALAFSNVVSGSLQ